MILNSSRRTQQHILVIAAGGCLFSFGVYVGWCLTQASSFNKIKPGVGFHAEIGSDSSPVQYHQHTEPLRSNLQPNSPLQPSGLDSSKSACLAYPSAGSDVVIVVKTGATEALSRIPVQLLTFLSCANDDVLFFSDMEQNIGGFHIHDALLEVVPNARTANSDFDLYETQKQLKLFGEDIASLSKAKEAWELDKYKNIHTAQKAWDLRPNKSWYFFIDADTYIVWSSFFAWLKQLNPAKDLYLGNTMHTAIPFAHGGSGYLVSRTGMIEIVGSQDAKKIAADFDISASKTCCGDAEFTGALAHKNISLIDAYPLLNDRKPRNIPYGPKHWCQPIVTMHHLNTEEMNDLWLFEQSRLNPESPLLFEELFAVHISPKMSSQLTDWNNLSEEDIDDQDFTRQELEEGRGEESEKEVGNSQSELTPILDANGTTQSTEQQLPFWPVSPNPNEYNHSAVNNCAHACHEKASCFQYLWDGQFCRHSTKSFTLGEMSQVENEKRWVSGWDLEKVRQFQRENRQCGNGLWEYHE